MYDLNAYERARQLEREALRRAQEELFAKGITYPFYDANHPCESHEALRAYSDLESSLVIKYKKLISHNDSRETTEVKERPHWTDR